MTMHDADVVAALLCGCTIEQITTTLHQEVQFELDEPRRGHMTLRYCGTQLLEIPCALDQFAGRSRWARTIDWVDLLDDATFLVCLSNGETITLRAAEAAFVEPIRVAQEAMDDEPFCHWQGRTVAAARAALCDQREPGWLWCRADVR